MRSTWPRRSGFTGDTLVTRKGRRERKRGSNAGKGGWRRGLRYEFTIAILLPLLFLLLLLSSSSLFVLRNASPHRRAGSPLSRDFLFLLFFSPALSSSIYVPLNPPCSFANHSSRAYRITINGFRFRCLNLGFSLLFVVFALFLADPLFRLSSVSRACISALLAEFSVSW